MSGPGGQHVAAASPTTWPAGRAVLLTGRATLRQTKLIRHVKVNNYSYS